MTYSDCLLLTTEAVVQRAGLGVCVLCDVAVVDDLVINLNETSCWKASNVIQHNLCACGCDGRCKRGCNRGVLPVETLNPDLNRPGLLNFVGDRSVGRNTNTRDC